MKIGIRAFVYDDADMQLMVSSLMEEGELAFGISHSGSNYNVMNCLRNARENGADTVALVSQGKTPLSKIADTVLYSSAEETIFQSESVSTRIAQLAMIDTLVAIVAFEDYENSYMATRKPEKPLQKINCKQVITNRMPLQVVVICSLVFCSGSPVRTAG